ncbi:hypothetical protein EYF80_002575 [Liparis tanakae]|uniref:Uncharacterized protein n=1 Tax=Liparis tanakae TaxID=230148 RepID=A0A4Z2JC26_9TELE|nr:hypothetical protein EYF80_002575 [Liparis tanakae]
MGHLDQVFELVQGSRLRGDLLKPQTHDVIGWSHVDRTDHQTSDLHPGQLHGPVLLRDQGLDRLLSAGLLLLSGPTASSSSHRLLLLLLLVQVRFAHIGLRSISIRSGTRSLVRICIGTQSLVRIHIRTRSLVRVCILGLRILQVHVGLLRVHGVGVRYRPGNENQSRSVPTGVRDVWSTAASDAFTGRGTFGTLVSSPVF